MVKPDYVNPTDEFGFRDDLSARLVVDGAPFRESGSTVTINTRSYASSELSRDIILDLQKGTHTVKLQWRKWGNYVRTWRSSPSFLDGFSSSRFLAVHGERRSIAAIQQLSFHQITDVGSWHTVGDKILPFTLESATTVLFSYGLPVTQMSSPTLDEWTFERWAEIGARLVVDGVPYTHSGTSLEGNSAIYDEMRGRLVLELPAGDHTVSLQWKILNDADAVPWTTLNRAVDGYQGAEELLVLVNHQTSSPEIILPDQRLLPTSKEDEDFTISGTFVSKIDASLMDEYRLGITLSATFGTISLTSTRSITFTVGDGSKDEVMYFSGSTTDINNALKSITYRPLLNRFGTETITFKVDDLMYLGAGEAYSETKLLTFEVESVDDLPTIMTPSNQQLAEDGSIIIRGVALYDADVMTSDSTFQLTVSCKKGEVTLYEPTADGLTFLLTSDTTNSKTVEATVSTLNNLIQQITYIPETDFNDHHSTSEEITITVVDLSLSTDNTVTSTIPISVIPENDAPTINVPKTQQIKLSGFELFDSGAPNSQPTTVKLSVDNEFASISLKSSHAGVTFTAGSSDTFARQVALTGSLSDVSDVLDTLQYMRNSSSILDGGDSIKISVEENPGSESSLVSETIFDFSINNFASDHVNAVQIDMISPPHGSSLGGTTVVVEGVNFLDHGLSGGGPLFCQFGSNGLAPATINSDEELTCDSPADTSNSELDKHHTVFLRITNGIDFWSPPIQFTYETAHIISSISLPRGPTTGGSTLYIIGSDFDPNSNLQCNFGGSRVPALWLNQTTIQCITPPATGGTPGPVQLSFTTNDQDVASNLILFHYQSAPTITSIEPIVGPTVGGTRVTVSGANFNEDTNTVCNFDGVDVASSFISSTTIICSSPPAATAATDDVILKVSVDGGSTYTSTDSEEETHNFRYKNFGVTSLSPSFGPVDGDTAITVYGYGFEDSTHLKCSFGGVHSDHVTLISETEIVCDLPPHVQNTDAIVTLGVTINDQDYSPDKATFTYTYSPIFSSISPASGPVNGGTRVLINGYNFVDSPSTLKCSFGDFSNGDSVVGARFISSTQIECHPAPMTDQTEGVDLYFSMNGADFLSTGRVFTYMQLPSVTGLNPSRGDANGNTVVTVAGENFVFSKDLSCRFGSGDAHTVVAARFNADDEVVCITPYNSAGATTSIVAVSNNGLDFGPSNGVSFTYTNTVEISSIYPTKGSRTGGTVITVSGYNFPPTDIKCRFGGDINTEITATFVDGGKILCTSPASTKVQSIAVEVSTNGGSDFTSNNFHYSFINDAFLTQIKPVSGPRSGSTLVQLSGYNFVDGSSLSCRFGGIDGSVTPATYVSSTSVECVAPANDQVETVDITISNNGVDFSNSAASYSYVRDIEIHSVSPSSGKASGGTPVTVTGSNFEFSGDLSCRFGDDGTDVNPTFVNGNTIICVTPYATVTGLVPLMVTNNGVDYEEGGDAVVNFNFAETVSIDSISPRSGSINGGTVVTISGSGFSDTDDVLCNFGDDDSSSEAYFIDSSTITCISPPSSTTKYVNVEVSVGGGESTFDNHRFEYTRMAVFTSLSPSGGPFSGGTHVLVSGYNFVDSYELGCKFVDGDNSEVIVPARYISTTRVECVTPASTSSLAASKTVSVWITMNGIDFITINGEFNAVADFTYQSETSISSINPSFGPSEGGTAITVTGSNFELGKALSCRFGNSGDHAVKVNAVFVSESQVTCISPPALSADVTTVSIFVSNGGLDYGSSSAVFEYMEPISLSSINPRKGSIEGGTTVTITGANFNGDYDTPPSCTFGGVASSAAVYVSESEIHCTTPPSISAAFVTVEVSNNNVDFAASATLFEYAEEATISGIKPANGDEVGNTKVIVSGANFVESENLGCLFGGVPGTATYLTGNSIECSSPAASSLSGSVLLQITMNGEDFIDSPVPFAFLPSITIDSISPNFGEVDGNTPVTLTGSNFVFSGDLYCRFKTTKVAASFVSSSTIICASPASTDENNRAVDLSVTNNDVDYSAPTTFTYVEGASITSIFPKRGSLEGGTIVTVSGENFMSSDGLGCKFDKPSVVVVPAMYVDESTITCITPSSNSLVSSSILVTNNNVDFSPSPQKFHYINNIAVFSVSPTVGHPGISTTVVLSGFNFVDSSEVLCKFENGDDSIVTSGRFISSNQIECDSPSNGDVGSSHELHLSVNGQDFVNTNHNFFYEEAPKVDSFSPTFGPQIGATTVTVTGENFSLTKQLSCRFGSISVKAAFVSSETILCVTPTVLGSDVSSLQIYVSSNGVNWFSSASAFEFVTSASISSISPSSGPIAGGTAVTISGTGFEDSALINCLFKGGPTGGGGNEIVAGDYLSPTSVKCVSPVCNGCATSTFVSLEVSTNGVSYTSMGHQFYYLTSPAVTSIYPISGSITGGTQISAFGYNFVESDKIKCAFGSEIVPGDFLSATEITCDVPSSPYATVVDFDVTFNDLDYTNSNIQFSYVGNLLIDSLAPTSGSVLGGTVVTVTGSNFEFSQYLRCKFDEMEVMATFVNSNTVTCIAPANVDETKVSVNIKVSNNGLDYYGGEGNVFVYTSDFAVVTDVAPTSVSTEGGAVITLSGSNFVVGDIDTTVCSFREGATHVLISSTPGIIVDGNTITCPTPIFEKTTEDYFVYIEVDVNDIDYRYINENHMITVVDTPVIKQNTIAVAHFTSESEAATVVVEGYNFINTEKASCSFIGVGSSDTYTSEATYLSPTMVSCKAPTDVFGDFNVFLSFDNGSTWTTNHFFATVLAPVSVQSIHPAVATTSGATIITVTGSNFDATKAHSYDCVFGSFVSMATRVDSSTLLCLSPKGVHTKAGFKVSQGGVEDETALTYSSLHAISVDSLSPSSFDSGGGSTVTVSVHVAGGESDALFISDTVVCTFGGAEVPGQVIENDLVQCTSPDTSEETEGILTIHYADHVDLVTNIGKPYKSFPEPTITHIFPTYGVEGTESTVTVTGANFVSSSKLSCRFGDGYSVAARFITSRQLECTSEKFTDSDMTGPLFVSVSNNGVDFKTFSGAKFSFVSQSTVVSFTPSRGGIDGGTAVNVYGTSFRNVADLQCRFGDEYITQGRFVSSNEVICVTPSVGVVVGLPLRICYGESENCALESLNEGNNEFFNFRPNLVVTSFEPKIGPLTGDTVVTFVLEGDDDGSEDAEEASCRFGETVVAATMADDQMTYTCFSPPSSDLSTNTVPFEVSTNKRDYSASGNTFSYYQSITVSKVSPTHVSERSGNSVLITGQNFLNVETLVCQFGIDVVAAIYISDTEIRCAVPQILAPQKDLQLRVGNSANELSTEYLTMAIEPLVTLHSVFPTNGKVTGSEILTLYGTNFVPSSSMACKFDEVVVGAHYISADKIQCITPAKSGEEDSVLVRVTRNGVDFSSETVVYTYSDEDGEALVSSASPRIYSKSSLNAYFGDSMDIRLVGSNFDKLEGEVYCVANFGSGEYEGDIVGSEVVSIDSELIVCRITDHNELSAVPAVGNLEIYVLDGSSTSATPELVLSLENAIEYHDDMFITGVFPSFTTYSDDLNIDNSEVIVKGENFINSPSLGCMFGDVVVTGRFISRSRIGCVPPSIAGTIDEIEGDVGAVMNISVSNDGQSFTSDDIKFRYYHSPKVAEVVPASGSSGSTITVTGANFNKAMGLMCFFGEGAATYSQARFISSSVVECAVPAVNKFTDGETISVTLQSSAGHTSNNAAAVKFTYFDSVPVVTSVTPSSGFNNVDTLVSVAYTGSKKTITRCYFGSVQVEISSCNEESCECLVPASTGTNDVVAGEVLVSFEGSESTSSNFYTSSSSSVFFTYLAPMKISAITPTSGPAMGGGVVTLTGTNFSSSLSRNSCAFKGGQTYSSPETAKFVNKNTITCLVPADMKPDKYTVSISESESDAVYNSYAEIVITELTPSWHSHFSIRFQLYPHHWPEVSLRHRHHGSDICQH